MADEPAFNVLKHHPLKGPYRRFIKVYPHLVQTTNTRHKHTNTFLRRDCYAIDDKTYPNAFRLVVATHNCACLPILQQTLFTAPDQHTKQKILKTLRIYQDDQKYLPRFTKKNYHPSSTAATTRDTIRASHPSDQLRQSHATLSSIQPHGMDESSSAVNHPMAKRESVIEARPRCELPPEKSCSGRVPHTVEENVLELKRRCGESKAREAEARALHTQHSFAAARAYLEPPLPRYGPTSSPTLDHLEQPMPSLGSAPSNSGHLEQLIRRDDRTSSSPTLPVLPDGSVCEDDALVFSATTGDANKENISGGGDLAKSACVTPRPWWEQRSAERLEGGVTSINKWTTRWNFALGENRRLSNSS